MLKPLLVLCLGNEIISDDRFGPEVARRLQEESGEGLGADVIFAPLAGFRLLDLLAGRRAALIVDTIRTGHAAPGTLHEFPAGVLTPSKNLTTSHQISLPTALELGRQLGVELPEVIDVLAVEAHDLETLREEMTAPVQEAMDKALQFVYQWIERNSSKESDHADSN
ncbi:hydrogenase maturation protease [bacterium]|nr:hydrogenase maturation protease [bacterium]MBU1984856.1 hydrogenase maturation protease [bacterium]